MKPTNFFLYCQNITIVLENDGLRYYFPRKISVLPFSSSDEKYLCMCLYIYHVLIFNSKLYNIFKYNSTSSIGMNRQIDAGAMNSRILRAYLPNGQPRVH